VGSDHRLAGDRADLVSAAGAELVRGPYFDELSVGQVFRGSPSVTLTGGRSAVHGSIVGNRLRLALDDDLALAVTGSGGFVAPPMIWDLSIGQSTVVTQHVKANLFYRSLRFRRMPRLGDTLTTVTTVDGLKENTRRPGRPPTGLAALHIVTTDQHGRDVLDYWRCAMLPLSGSDVAAGPRDDLDGFGQFFSGADESWFSDWDLGAYRDAVPGGHFAGAQVGKRWAVRIADVVTSAPELARLTGNVAAVHHDAAAAGGTRLVYGGHTIGLAFHQICSAIPEVVTVVGWHSCDHTAPVREGDVLVTDVEVVGRRPLPDGGLADLRAVVTATDAAGESRAVLDWTLTVLLA
jgi:acyl dehydratase